ncbi:MAG: HNH endonuclease [Promethearchaeota archaeon]|jgi:rubrerythrin
MSKHKKTIRARFRASVFDRDRYMCRMCGHTPETVDELDAHHITDRALIVNGGYVPENGIALCPICHMRAEKYHVDGRAFPGYAPADLYREIGSSSEIALEASKRLK